jgi:hypothetical protein
MFFFRGGAANIGIKLKNRGSPGLSKLNFRLILGIEYNFASE